MTAEKFPVDVTQAQEVEVTTPEAAELCVGMRLFNLDECSDPEVVSLSTRIGKCVTCTSCQMQLEEQAFNDELTGLGNRHALKSGLAAMMRQDMPILFIFTDLRNFKPVNENLSYIDGDRLLIAAAHTLNDLFPDEEGVVKGRAGGDEMVVLKQLCRDVDDGVGNVVTVPISPKEAPAIETQIAHEILRGFDELEEFNDYNDQFGYTSSESLGVRVGTITVYPADLRARGRTVELKKLMLRADPKTHNFAWNRFG